MAQRLTERGLPGPLAFFLGYGAQRPSFGRSVIVLLDKNFHSDWHANNCMKHVASSGHSDEITPSSNFPSDQKAALILAASFLYTFVAEKRNATVQLFGSCCEINTTLLL